MTDAPTSHPRSIWQVEKRLSSRDLIWILTDICGYSSSFHEWSPEQQWFRVGVYDLGTKKLGYVRFGIDDARALLTAGLQPPPWPQPAARGVEVTRQAHRADGKGR